MSLRQLLIIIFDNWRSAGLSVGSAAVTVKSSLSDTIVAPGDAKPPAQNSNLT